MAKDVSESRAGKLRPDGSDGGAERLRPAGGQPGSGDRGNTRFRAGREPEKLEAVFIRAPIIRRAGPGVKVLARYAGDPVLVEDGSHLAATFHPELTADARVHRLFLEKL